MQYKIEKSKQGAPTLAVTGDDGRTVYVHSKYDPLKEAQSLADKFNPDKYDALIVLGAGLGYHLIPLRELAGK